MSKKSSKTDSPVESLKNESARQRWELFHRAIAHAKRTNDAAATDSDTVSNDPDSPPPLLTVVR